MHIFSKINIYFKARFRRKDSSFQLAEFNSSEEAAQKFSFTLFKNMCSYIRRHSFYFWYFWRWISWEMKQIVLFLVEMGTLELLKNRMAAIIFWSAEVQMVKGLCRYRFRNFKAPFCRDWELWSSSCKELQKI